MKLKKKIFYSGVISAAALITSIFIPLVPCRVGPGIPNPIFSWKICALNPDKITSLGSIIKYFGYTSSLKDAYIFLIVAVFIISFSFFHFFVSSRGK